jgi:hypothetical protein
MATILPRHGSSRFSYIADNERDALYAIAARLRTIAEQLENRADKL